MSLLFDSTILIDLERGNPSIKNELRRLRLSFPGYPTITFTSYYEFLYGIRNRKGKNREKALSFIKIFDVLAMTKETARILCELRQCQESKGKPLPLADLLIAAQAIEYRHTLVTQDKDFNQITELKKIML